MLIAYSPPTPIVWTLAGTGAEFVSDNTALSDGIPARETEIGWLSADPALITDYLTLRGHFDVATPVRVVAVLGLRSVPEGTKLELRGEIAGSPGAYVTLGGNALTQTVFAFVDGTFGAWFVVDADNDPLSGIELRIYNDVDGVTWAAAATTIRIGEIFLAPAVDVWHEQDWGSSRVDPSSTSRTIGSQLARVVRTPYRRLRARFVPESLANVRGRALGNGIDLDALEAALMGSEPCAAISRWKNADESIDATELNRTALYGQAAFEPTNHAGGNYYAGGWTFEEIPAG